MQNVTEYISERGGIDAVNHGLNLLNQDPFDPADPFRCFKDGRTPTVPEMLALNERVKPGLNVRVYSGMGRGMSGKVVSVYRHGGNVWSYYVMLDVGNAPYYDAFFTSIIPA